LPTELYANGSVRVYLKTDAGRILLTHAQILSEIRKRNGLETREYKNAAMKMVFAETHREHGGDLQNFMSGTKKVECKKCGEIFIARRLGYTIPAFDVETISCPAGGSTKRFDRF
jgi:hypothetical protein